MPPIVLHKQKITRREASRLMVLGGLGVFCPRVDGWFAFSSEQQRSAQSLELEAVLERVRREHELPGLAAAIVSGARGTVSGVTGLRRLGS